MAAWLHAAGRHLGAAALRGRLLDLGGYPGLVEAARSTDWVSGDLYALACPVPSLRALDRYERGAGWRGAAEYARVRRRVRVGRRWRSAWVYLYVGSVLGKRRIAAGDYLAPGPGSGSGGRGRGPRSGIILRQPWKPKGGAS